MLFWNYITNRPKKCIVVQELEKHFNFGVLTFSNASHLQTSLTDDFMSIVCRMSISEMNVFLDLFSASLRKLSNACKHQHIDLITISYPYRRL